jgi:hypothetical protein
MKYTAYVICAPGMDRPCFSHHPPTEEQKMAFAAAGTHVYSFELDIPGFDFIDGRLKNPFMRPVPPG